MTSFIKGRYLFALTLIRAKEDNPSIDAVTFTQIRKLSSKLQEFFNQNNIDACVVDYNFAYEIQDYSEYFEMISLNGDNYVKSNLSLEQLKQEFLGMFYVMIGITNVKKVSEFLKIIDLNDLHW